MPYITIYWLTNFSIIWLLSLSVILSPNLILVQTASIMLLRSWLINWVTHSLRWKLSLNQFLYVKLFLILLLQLQSFLLLLLNLNLLLSFLYDLDYIIILNLLSFDLFSFVGLSVDLLYFHDLWEHVVSIFGCLASGILSGVISLSCRSSHSHSLVLS